MTTLLSAVDEIEGRKQLTDEEYAALKERVKVQGAVVKASKEARAAAAFGLPPPSAASPAHRDLPGESGLPRLALHRQSLQCRRLSW